MYSKAYVSLSTLILVVASFLLIFLSTSCMLGSNAASNSSLVVREIPESFNPEKPMNWVPVEPKSSALLPLLEGYNE